MAARHGCRRGLVGCATLLSHAGNPTLMPASSITATGFRNNYPHATDQSFWQWQYERFMANLPPPAPAGGGRALLPSARPDIAFLRENRNERSLTWLGHATVLLQTAGVNIITDPMFSGRASPVRFAGRSDRCSWRCQSTSSR